MNDLVSHIASRFSQQHPNEAARVLDEFTPEEAVEALAPLPADARVEVVQRMNADAAARALARLEATLARETLLLSDSVRIARWSALLEPEDRERLMALLPQKQARDVAQAIEYPPGTAGALMDPGALPFDEETSIDAVIRTLRGIKNRRITDIMVCDDERLIGVVPTQELLGAAGEATLGSLALRNPHATHVMATRDDVVELLETHRLASVPVVDLDGRLMGIIRYDTLVQAAQQAATHDLQKMVGAGSEERALSTPIFTVKSRLPWLLINLLTAFAAASVVGIFDATIAQFTALAVLLPVVAGQSGNTGAQALAVISRGLALREIRLVHWWRVVRKEIAAATANGIVVGVVTAAGVLVWSSNIGLTFVIGVSMVASMVLAAMSGAIIPILLTAAGRDPATASSILLTTVTDITGFFSFLGLATLMKDYLA